MSTQESLRKFARDKAAHFVCEGSGKKTSSALIYTGECILKGAFLYTDGTNDASLIIYDGTTATGKILREVHAKGADGKGPFGDTAIFVRAKTGVYGELTGTNAYFIVETISAFVT